MSESYLCFSPSRSGPATQAHTRNERDSLFLFPGACPHLHTHTRTHIPSYSVSFSLSLSHLLAPHLSPIMWKETCLRAFKKRNGYSGGWGVGAGLFFQRILLLVFRDFFSLWPIFFPSNLLDPSCCSSNNNLPSVFSSFISIKKLLIEYHLRNLDEIIVRQETNLRLCLSVKTNQLGVM